MPLHKPHYVVAGGGHQESPSRNPRTLMSEVAGHVGTYIPQMRSADQYNDYYDDENFDGYERPCRMLPCCCCWCWRSLSTARKGTGGCCGGGRRGGLSAMGRAGGGQAWADTRGLPRILASPAPRGSLVLFPRRVVPPWYKTSEQDVNTKVTSFGVALDLLRTFGSGVVYFSKPHTAFMVTGECALPTILNPFSAQKRLPRRPRDANPRSFLRRGSHHPRDACLLSGAPQHQLQHGLFDLCLWYGLSDHFCDESKL